MTSAKVIVFSTLLAVIFVVYLGHVDSIPALAITPSPENVQACGRELADILQKTCKSGYNTYHIGEQEPSSTPLAGKRSKRGIIQECCLQPCSFTDLSSYCSEDSNNMDKGNVTGSESVEMITRRSGKTILTSSAGGGNCNNSRTFEANSVNIPSVVDNEIKTGDGSRPCKTDNDNEIITPELSDVVKSVTRRFNSTIFSNRGLNNFNRTSQPGEGSLKNKPLYYEGKKPLIMHFKSR